jgi:ABC-type glycerol-3-phosphate transport system permease component
MSGLRPVMSALPSRAMPDDLALVRVLEASIEILKTENEILKRLAGRRRDVGGAGGDHKTARQVGGCRARAASLMGPLVVRLESGLGGGLVAKGQLSDKALEEYRQRLENQYQAGTLGRAEMIDALARFDVAQATVRSAKYMLWSVIVAAISAVASAISAAFSAYAAWPRK